MSPPMPPSRSADQFVVRLPDGMRDRIADAAKANNRSMNAEIVARLQDSFRDDSRLARGIPTSDQRLDYLQLLYDAFQATSDNFTEEIGSRLSKYLSSVPTTEIDTAEAAEKLKKLLRFRDLS